MAPGSGWEALAAVMVCGKDKAGNWLRSDDGLFLNYQLTSTRGAIFRQVRLARKLHRQHLHKFSVNQNGEIKILKVKAPRDEGGRLLAPEGWTKVESMKHLKQLLPLVPFQLEEEMRPQRQGQREQQQR